MGGQRPMWRLFLWLRKREDNWDSLMTVEVKVDTHSIGWNQCLPFKHMINSFISFSFSQPLITVSLSPPLALPAS